MSDEKFMRHHYGASGYVPPDSPLTPWGEQLARVQEMCTEGYGGLSARDKDDIRAVYHRLLDLFREAACPCCHAGTNITLEPCQECHGTGLVSVAYDSLRIHCKLLSESKLPDGVLAEWIFHQCRYRALDKGANCWIVQRELAVENSFDSWSVEKIL